jgi:Ca2+-binding RTX toxin-like protein
VIVLTFDAGQLGVLPDHVGAVYTDAAGNSLVTFEAFDDAGTSLGVASLAAPPDLSNGHPNDVVDEDRFIGFFASQGIKQLVIRSNASATSQRLQIDHVQYGRSSAEGQLPSPPPPGSYVGSCAAGRPAATAFGSSGTAGDDVLESRNLDDFILNGNAGNDRIYGSGVNNSITGGEGDDYIVGGPGDDVIVIGLGNDVVCFDRGDGQDNLGIESFRPTSENVIQFGDGITPADVVVTANSIDIVGTQDRIIFIQPGFGPGVLVRYVRFRDGTQWDLSVAPR